MTKDILTLPVACKLQTVHREVGKMVPNSSLVPEVVCDTTMGGGTESRKNLIKICKADFYRIKKQRERVKTLSLCVSFKIGTDRL